MTMTMNTYTCICGYTYDPEKGHAESGIEPGTTFEDLPDGWVCPACGSTKDKFSMMIITLQAVTKTFGDVTALKDITVRVEEAAIFGLLGPDGSGKTALLKVMTGLFKPTSGSCFLFGRDVSKNAAQALEHVGCLVGEPAFYTYYTAAENLHLFADLLGTPKDEVKLESLGILFGHVPGKHLTFSMKKHLGIALALLGAPRLLLLDEPLTNLDAAARTQIKEVLQSEAEKKTTIFFTTCNPQDIKDLATTGALLQEGEITAQGPVKTVLDQYMEGEK